MSQPNHFDKNGDCVWCGDPKGDGPDCCRCSHMRLEGDDYDYCSTCKRFLYGDDSPDVPLADCCKKQLASYEMKSKAADPLADDVEF
jgi:hypothetical protein